MRTSPLQQALTGLAVALVIAATLLGGLILALSDISRGERTFAGGLPTPTVFRIPTLPLEPATRLPELQPPTALPIMTDTPRPTDTRQPSSTPTATVTATVLPTATSSPRLTLSPTPRSTQRRTVTPSSTATVMATVPTVTQHPATVTPDVTGTQTSTDGICTNSDSIITTPRVGAVLTGKVQFYGTASIPDFSFYKLEIRPELWSTASDYITFYTGYSPVYNGLLGILDTAPWEDGEYWIRLVVVNTTGNYPERCAILYSID